MSRPNGRRPRFTGRAAVLALVLCSLVAALAYPTRQFIAQRAQIAQQRAAAEQAQAQVDELRREKARWQDPAYVTAQARERLHYGFPGETPFTSVDPDPSASATARATAQAQAAAGAAGQPWYDNLFESLDASDTAPH
ncbi:FtsB family cell division protein [Streptacidiphilus cavernicola]|uniref:Septum formation initiator family protein n=1 Tax=Streptacidiphilus cavernicola TaxID=3342716 RepID=A0ABV6VN19_9ACTN